MRALAPKVKWLSDRPWTAASGAPGTERTRAQFLGEWHKLLAHYREIEDVRFKVRFPHLPSPHSACRCGREPLGTGESA